jgi:hypothetical protein
MDKMLILWTFLTFSHGGKSRNATQNRGDKYNIYLTNSGQNAAFWTFFERGCQDS